MDLVKMSAEEAGDVLAALFQTSASKQADWKADLGGLWDAGKKHVGEALKNPYVRNTAIGAGGGAALSAIRNMGLSPEERKRRSLMGDTLTGASLGGLAGAGGTMAYNAAQKGSPVLNPGAANVAETQDINRGVQQAGEPGAPWMQRAVAFKDKLMGRPDTAGSAAAPTTPALPHHVSSQAPADLWTAAKQLLPAPVSPAIAAGEAALGGGAGAAATSAIRRMRAPWQLVGMPDEALKKVVESPDLRAAIARGNTSENKLVRTGKSIAGMGSIPRTLGLNTPASTAPEQRLLDQAATKLKSDLDHVTMQAGYNASPEITKAHDRLKKTLDSIKERQTQLGATTPSNDKLYRGVRADRTAGRSTTRNLLSSLALPLLGAAAGGAHGTMYQPQPQESLPAGPSLLQSIMGGLKTQQQAGRPILPSMPLSSGHGTLTPF